MASVEQMEIIKELESMSNFSGFGVRVEHTYTLKAPNITLAYF